MYVQVARRKTLPAAIHMRTCCRGNCQICLATYVHIHIPEQRYHILHFSLGRATLFRTGQLKRVGLALCAGRGTSLGRTPSTETRLVTGLKWVGMSCPTLAEMQEVVSLFRYVR